MHRAGVRIVAGSDMSAYLIHPGFSLHEELQRLSDAGMSTADVLRAATLKSPRCSLLCGPERFPAAGAATWCYSTPTHSRTSAMWRVSVPCSSAAECTTGGRSTNC
jgi:hypothetical protein